MALSQYRTRDQMVTEVLVRCGLGVQGELTSDLHPQVQGDLREAQHELWHKCRWMRNRTRVEIEAVADQTEYDFPDTMDTGSVDQVQAKDTSGRVWALEPGIRADDRSLAALEGISGTDEPSRWSVNDTVLEVLSAPGDTIESLIIEGWLKPNPLIAPDARPAVDDEAMIRYAVIKLQKFKGQFTVAEARAELADLYEGYVADLQGDEAVPETFVMGGQYVDAQDLPLPSSSRPWWRANRRP